MLGRSRPVECQTWPELASLPGTSLVVGLELLVVPAEPVAVLSTTSSRRAPAAVRVTVPPGLAVVPLAGDMVTSDRRRATACCLLVVVVTCWGVDDVVVTGRPEAPGRLVPDVAATTVAPARPPTAKMPATRRTVPVRLKPSWRANLYRRVTCLLT